MYQVVQKLKEMEEAGHITKVTESLLLQANILAHRPTSVIIILGAFDYYNVVLNEAMYIQHRPIPMGAELIP